MDIETASEILAGSILTGLSFVVFVITIVVINNILHKYWKPVVLWKFTDYPTARFMDTSEYHKQEPKQDPK
jgi:hypothetical protein